MTLELPLWVAMHALYTLTTNTNKDQLLEKTLSKEFQHAVVYLLICIALFSFLNKMIATAVLISCVITCIYVFCGMILRLVVFFSRPSSYWKMVLLVNNILIVLILLYFSHIQ